MSGFSDIYKLESIVIDVCPLFDSSISGAGLAVLLDFYPLLLTFSIFSISLYKQELYLMFVSFSLTLNWFLNYFLQNVIFLDHGAFLNCGSYHQNPSFSTQHICCLDTMLALYCVTWSRKIMYTNLFVLHLFSHMVVWARIFIGINTRTQLVVGSLVGFISGILFHLAILLIAYPNFGHILSWRIMR